MEAGKSPGYLLKKNLLGEEVGKKWKGLGSIRVKHWKRGEGTMGWGGVGGGVCRENTRNMMNRARAFDITIGAGHKSPRVQGGVGKGCFPRGAWC